MSSRVEEPPRVVLVETSDALPGLLPFQAWDALAVADEVLVRDVRSHPSVAHLHAAGIDLAVLPPARLERADLDLGRPGSPDDRRLAKALAERAEAGSVPVFLLGPQDDGLAAALAGMAADRDLEIELVFFAPQPSGTELLRIVEVMRRLRDPDNGCPWDLEQDHASLVRYLIEETYELVDAIEAGDDADLVEELGDVLLQVVFHARVAADRSAFGIDDVARGIADKLISRHPHVFADGDAETAADVQENWERLKAEEKGRTGPFDGVPRAMPALLLLDKVQHKAAKHDPRWRDDDPPARVRAAVDAVLAADRDGTPEGVDARDLVGDALAALVALARAHGVDAESAARNAADRLRDAVAAD